LVGLVASSPAAHRAMEEFFAPPGVSRRKRMEMLELLHRVGDPGAPSSFDILVRELGLPPVAGAVAFDFANPERSIRAILRTHKEFAIALARNFPPFRRQVTGKIIRDVSRENAFFAFFAALPNVMPGLAELLWAPAEFATDTAFLTVNQIRMAFLLAAASDLEVGYTEQKGQVASIIASAFGWRALARELAGKVPFGAGLIPKAAIAYAGTYAVGRSLERYCRIGYGFSRAEREAAFREAFEHGKAVARSFLTRTKPETESERAAS
jgi:uncharacterized protein (DUF697 family)